jgi:hypothetical protein
MQLITSTTEALPVVFTAQSKVYFYCRDAVCEFVFSRGAVPINPFRVFEYFLGDRVDREIVRQGNNNLIRKVDELWVFGEVIADGVLSEVCFATQMKKPIRFFTIHNKATEIREISIRDLKFEPEVYGRWKLKTEELVDRMLGRDPNAPVQLSFLDGQGNT